MTSMPTRKEMELAFRRGDSSYDGIFFVGVSTTGVFCRPSCPARKPLPQNVAFYPTAHDAVFAGYRPCKRCRPMHTEGKPPEWVARLLERVEEDPSRRIKEADLRSWGLTPERVRRHFTRTYGMTFQAYCRGRRMGEALGQIRAGAGLDDVALGHGWDSHSGFRDAFVKAFGKPPGKSRSEGCIELAWLESPLGPLVAGATAEGLCLLEFTDRRMLEAQFHTLRRVLCCSIIPGRNSHHEKLKEELGLYFEGTLRKFSVPILASGTPFQMRVWEELLGIPYGETLSYEELARAVGRPGACRAVGTANGCNRIAIVVPCHRVVNKSGALGGYGGGLWRKQRLLDLEREGLSA